MIVNRNGKERLRVNRTKEIEMTGEESMYLYVSDDTESLDERMKGVSELR